MEKKSNKGLIIVLVLFILISIVLGGYIVYDKGYLDSLLGKEKVVNPKEGKEVEKLSVDDKVIQDLYVKIKKTNVYDQMLIDQVLENKTEIIVKEDFDSYTLNYYGYRNLKDSKLEKDFCQNYPNILALTDYICGEDSDTNTDTTNNYTNVFVEEDLKESVEEIFGKNSYKTTEIIGVSFGEYYVYDSISKKYVDTYVKVDGDGEVFDRVLLKEYKVKLVDVKQKENGLSLIESVKYEDNDNSEDSVDEKISYNYRLDNGAYYLYSISLVK